MGIHWAEALALPGSMCGVHPHRSSVTRHPEAEWPRQHLSQPCLGEPASPAPSVSEAPSLRGGVGETGDQGMGDC